MTQLTVLTPREASSFACLVDTVVAPAPPLPPVSETDAVASFDAWLALAPAPNRAALRGVLYPLARMRRLAPEQRVEFLERAGHSRTPGARQMIEAIRSTAALSYYGDTNVMRILGYDADARLGAGDP